MLYLCSEISKTTAPARVRPDPSGLRDARGTAQHTHPYHHESPNIAVKGATLLKEIAPHTKQHKRSNSKAVKLYDK